jgi:uncharacterized membrane protein
MNYAGAEVECRLSRDSVASYYEFLAAGVTDNCGRFETLAVGLVIEEPRRLLMRNQMTTPEWLFVILVVTGWTVFIVWFKRHSKRIPGVDNLKQYKTKQALISAVVNIGVGLLLTVVMLFNWKNVPPGNEIFGISFIAFGVVSILYGFYKYYRFRSSKH